ncbi:MAG TPA: sugar transferase [Afifellaceae bacterium]|nr:sugar transferase [Afifellaceae bacterium]
MKILWLDHGFSTAVGSTGIRSYDLARNLAEAGHEVTVLCGCRFMSCSGLTVPFRANRRQGFVDGIRIVEFNLAGGGHGTQRLRAWFQYASALAAHAASGFDLVIATSGSSGDVVAATIARLLRRIPMVYEVRSLSYRVERAAGRSNPLSSLLMSMLERLACRTADKVAAIADHVAEAASDFGVGRFDLETIPPFGSLPAADDTGKSTLPDRFPAIRPGQLVAAYTGPLDSEHGVDAVLDAAALLRLREREDIVILLAGEGPRRGAISRDIAVRQLGNVVMSGTQGRRSLLPVLGNCGVGLAVLDSDPEIHASAAPVEFADYLEAGLPVVINYPGWLAGLIAQHDCGYVVRPGAAAAFADALEHAADNPEALALMKRNAGDLLEQKFNRTEHLEQFRSLVESARLEAEARSGQVLKRTLDLAMAATGLVVFGPLLAILAALVLAIHGRPVFDRDPSPGLFGRPVGLLRFRTLRHAYRPDGGVLSDEERKTVLGRYLELTSLARLPRLWNVLRGDISFVGPRPLPLQALSHLGSDDFRRQFVRPGLISWKHPTGAADGGLADDVWYADNRTMALDLTILLNALLSPFRRFRRRADIPSRSGGDVDVPRNDQAAV